MYLALDQPHRRITVRLKSPNADFLGHQPNRGVAEEDFAEIAERFPYYLAADDRIELMLNQGHPDLIALIEFANSISLNIEPDRAIKSQVEILDYTKCSGVEIQRARCTDCHLLKAVFDTCIDFKNGRLFASGDWFKKTRHEEFGSVSNLPHLIFVRGSAKTKLETSGLRGL